MLVLDSSVWIDWLRELVTPQVAYVQNLKDAEEIVVPDLVLYEVLAGAVHERRAAKINTIMQRFGVVAALDPHTAQEAAHLYRTLQRLGITIRKPMDMLIAAFCIRYDHQLLHNDRDFVPIAAHCGLRLVDLKLLTH